jgi:16S rRNA (guanine(966)-N(2))-methyltransferase RsmD
MKVSAGKLKGRKILCRVSKDGTLRPTSSKVRESIFNIIGERIKESVFVDLYAGTGAVGIEAMSRGAKTVFFIEADKKKADAIEQTLSGCGCRPRAIILKKKAKSFIKSAVSEGIAFDIVFLDPPYYSDELETILPVLAETKVLNEDALVIAEHLTKNTLPDEVGCLSKKKTYKYGDTTLTLYRKVG